MDPFTERMLERAAERSKHLGITNASPTKFPLTESNSSSSSSSGCTINRNIGAAGGGKNQSPRKTPTKKSQTTKLMDTNTKYGNSVTALSRENSTNSNNSIINVSAGSPMKRQQIHRVSAADLKDNEDLSLEINIKTGPNVQVQVEVEEHEIDEDGNILYKNENKQQQKPLTINNSGSSNSPRKEQSQQQKRNGNNNNNNNQQQQQETLTTGTSMIRDSSRNRLQRLGALYSETENLSSPIHRNEERFDRQLEVAAAAEVNANADSTDSSKSLTTKSSTFGTSSTRSTRKVGKLAELANNIQTWEDDLSHPDIKSNKRIHATICEETTKTAAASPKKSSIISSNNNINSKTTTTTPSTGAIPKKVIIKTTDYPTPTKIMNLGSSNKENTTKISSTTTNTDNATASSKSKNLQWDKNVMDALEMQGFTRRESIAPKIVYDYSRELNSENTTTTTTTKATNVFIQPPPPPQQQQQAPSSTQTSSVTVVKSSSTAKPTAAAPASSSSAPPKQSISKITKGLVSDRAAIFECAQTSGGITLAGRAAGVGGVSNSQKDPAEMPLKERLALFEKNKGTALIPKAAFAMAVPTKQTVIQQTTSSTASPQKEKWNIIGQQQQQQPQKTIPPSPDRSKIDSFNKPVYAESNAAGNCIRNTVAALMTKGSTISETEISQDIRRQREKEMDVLLNRFNQRPETISECSTTSSSASAGQPSTTITTTTTATKPLSESDRLVKAQSLQSTPPPPPPPLPSFGGAGGASGGSSRINSNNNRHHVEAKCVVKRKSDENEYSDNSLMNKKKQNSDEFKKRKRTNRLYPVLSDIESTTTTSDDGISRPHQYLRNNHAVAGDYNEDDDDDDDDDNNEEYENDEEEDSYMNSEEENDEDDDDDDINNLSLGREIMQAVRRNDLQSGNGKNKISQQQYYHQQQQQQLDSSATGSEYSATNILVDDMDDYLDEALDDDEEITPKKGTISSNSFSYSRSQLKHHQPPTINEDDDDDDSDNGKFNSKHQSSGGKSIHFANPIKSELTVNPSDDNNVVTLTHTVSFYRRQQSQSVNNTPVRKVTYADNRVSTKTDETEQHKQLPNNPMFKNTENTDSVANANEIDNNDDMDDEIPYPQLLMIEEKKVKEKIERLLNEIHKQEQIISQSSQALNLCAATVEFSGSIESVEGERHLLVATHRRQVALNELQRLRVEKTVRPRGSPSVRGRVIVKDITVPLRPEYREKLSSETICGHHLVCLLKYNENVVATSTVLTLPGQLNVKFPGELIMDNVYADFKITLEIYGMTAQRELVPHEQKYHINRKTPKGKKHESRLIMPPVQSPGGPGAVRSPALCHYGFVIFSLKTCNNDRWTLNQVSNVSPLHEYVYMKVNCKLNIQIDHKGFLTMFEDVAGFGAWHRRWCRLRGNILSFWRYPDDENKKAPMGSIDLKNSCTQTVAVAPNEVCARKNTLLFEVKRPIQDGDKNSLVIQRHSNYTLVRHLLSADTKDECTKWCTYFNQSLMVIRSWGVGSTSSSSSAAGSGIKTGGGGGTNHISNSRI